MTVTRRDPSDGLPLEWFLAHLKPLLLGSGCSVTSVAGLVARKKSVALAGRRSFSPFDTSHTATDRRVLAFAGR